MKADDTPRFDAALRAHHAAALAHLSPQARAQLAQRRNAALRGERPAARSNHRLRFAAAGFATLCALALGLHLYSPLPPSPQSAPTAAPALAQAGSTAIGGSTPLEEDPAFYAWLGSSDVQQLAME